MKNILLLLSFLFFASLGFSQIKVETGGKVTINSSSTARFPLDIPINTPTSSTSQHGSFGIQSMDDKRGFLTNNSYWNGSAWTKLNALQPMQIIQFFDGEMFFRSAQTGTTFTDNLVIKSNGNVNIGYNWTLNPTMGKLNVNGSIFTTGSYLPSDKRLKTNIKSNFNYGLKEVVQINPVTYKYNGKAGIDDDNPKIGIIAQELEKIAPNLVGRYSVEEKQLISDVELGKNTRSEEYLYVKDSEIKFMLINAIKDLNQMATDQSAIITQLQSEIDELSIRLNESDLSNNVSEVLIEANRPLLKQNVPNPFKDATSIEYYIPEENSKATIVVYDLSGALIKSINLDGKGKGVLKLNTNNMPSGVYSYSLSVDGKFVSSNKMIIE